MLCLAFFNHLSTAACIQAQFNPCYHSPVLRHIKNYSVIRKQDKFQCTQLTAQYRHKQDANWYLKDLVGTAHGGDFVVSVGPSQFAEVTHRSSADLTVHVYLLHLMLWTHQHLYGYVTEQQRVNIPHCTSAFINA